jgi:hypothetical protein
VKAVAVVRIVVDLAPDGGPDEDPDYIIREGMDNAAVVTDWDYVEHPQVIP